ncbi:unnamed protein product, partial [Coregonus sp. 'balchen']
FGKIASILFTVLISIFRYQKLRDPETRGNLPIFLDNIQSAWAVSGLCVMLAILLGAPTHLMNLDGHMDNYTHDGGCPPDFFQCPKENCPTINQVHKYLFILLCNLLLLFIVTATRSLIVKVWGQPPRKKGLRGARWASWQPWGWTLYLVLYLAFSPYDFPSWSEVEFFITTSCTTISPYVYGIGSNLFSLKHFKR